MAYKQIQVKDLPAELVEQIGNEISEYSIGMVSMTANQNKVITNLIGSGTLVQFGEVYGILTAYHVTSSSAFRHCDRLGLLLMAQHAHHFSMPRTSLSIVPVGPPVAGQIGPDLSLIILPLADVSGIRAKKLFWNLGSHGDEILQKPRPIDEGAWVLWGCPDENTEQLQRDEHFLEITGYECMSGFGGVTKEWTEGTFDYLEFAVSYDALSESPLSFGGCSGGGLWQVPLVWKDDTISHERPILSGVAFHQSDVVDDRRKITCHGRVSTYRHVIEALERMQR